MGYRCKFWRLCPFCGPLQPTPGLFGARRPQTPGHISFWRRNHRLTRVNPPVGIPGLRRAGLRSRLWRASARLHPAALPAPIYEHWQVLWSFLWSWQLAFCTAIGLVCCKTPKKPLPGALTLKNRVNPCQTMEEIWKRKLPRVPPYGYPLFACTTQSAAVSCTQKAFLFP